MCFAASSSADFVYLPLSRNWKGCLAQDSADLAWDKSEKDLPSLKGPTGKSDTANEGMNPRKTQSKETNPKHFGVA
jgi:hypothetical protein